MISSDYVLGVKENSGSPKKFQEFDQQKARLISNCRNPNLQQSSIRTFLWQEEGSNSADAAPEDRHQEERSPNAHLHFCTVQSKSKTFLLFNILSF